MPYTLIEVLEYLQAHHGSIDGVLSVDYRGSGTPEDLADWLANTDSVLSELAEGLTHESLVGPTGPAVMSFEAWSTAYLTDLARDNGADVADDAVGTWIASNATALTNALQKCAMGFMLDADPIPGGDNA